MNFWEIKIKKDLRDENRDVNLPFNAPWIEIKQCSGRAKGGEVFREPLVRGATVQTDQRPKWLNISIYRYIAKLAMSKQFILSSTDINAFFRFICFSFYGFLAFLLLWAYIFILVEQILYLMNEFYSPLCCANLGWISFKNTEKLKDFSWFQVIKAIVVTVQLLLYDQTFIISV